MAAFPVFMDACVLYPQVLCDTLLTQAEAEIFRPLWSANVLDELGRALQRDAGLTDGQVAHRLDQMRTAFPDAEIAGYESLIDGLSVDEKDVMSWQRRSVRAPRC